MSDNDTCKVIHANKSTHSLKFNNFLSPKKEFSKVQLISVKPLNIPKPNAQQAKPLERFCHEITEVKSQTIDVESSLVKSTHVQS